MAASTWYRAGTISIQAGSKTVTGNNTKWSDAKQGVGAGQMLLVPGAGTVQMYEIVSVDSDTQLTLNDAWIGDTVTDSVYAIPTGIIGMKETLVLSTVARLGYYQQQMDGWQQIMTGTGDVTITAPDGTQVTISSFKKLTDDMSSKLDKTGNLAGLSDPAAARENLQLSDFATLTGPVPINKGGTGADNIDNAWRNLARFGTESDTAAEGNDSRLNTVDGKTSGTVSGATLVVNNNAQNAAFRSSTTNAWQESSGFYRNIFGEAATSATQFGQVDFVINNNAGKAQIRLIPYASSSAYYVFTVDHTGEAVARAFTQTSDERIKKNIQEIADPIKKLKMIRGVTFEYRNGGYPGIGFIAQDVEKAFPEHVSINSTPITLPDGTVIHDVKNPNIIGVSAALHQAVLLNLVERIESLESQLKTRDEAIVELQKRMKAIDGLDA